MKYLFITKTNLFPSKIIFSQQFIHIYGAVLVFPTISKIYVDFSGCNVYLINSRKGRESIGNVADIN